MEHVENLGQIGPLKNIFKQKIIFNMLLFQVFMKCLFFSYQLKHGGASSQVLAKLHYVSFQVSFLSTFFYEFMTCVLPHVSESLFLHTYFLESMCTYLFYKKFRGRVMRGTNDTISSFRNISRCIYYESKTFPWFSMFLNSLKTCINFNANVFLWQPLTWLHPLFSNLAYVLLLSRDFISFLWVT